MSSLGLIEQSASRVAYHFDDLLGNFVNTVTVHTLVQPVNFFQLLNGQFDVADLHKYMSNYIFARGFLLSIELFHIWHTALLSVILTMLRVQNFDSLIEWERKEEHSSFSPAEEGALFFLCEPCNRIHTFPCCPKMLPL